MTTIDFVSLGAAFLLATLLAAAAIPFVIRASQRWKLLDKPDARKAHRVPTPTLGGIGIFLGLVITVIVFGHATAPLSLAIVVGGCTLLFLTGIYDDLRDLSPSRKLLWQLVAALAVAASGARITSDFGLFGIGTLPLVVQYGLTVLVLTGVTNA
ncbi:MAG: undecaprenyl/decaprenyl-phosphate alpha-N-acetylglucosaminyl 1-phosphate transferase, partial [Bacteroidota bacterium]